MIARLTGILRSIEANTLTIGVEGSSGLGVAYEVLVPAFTARDMDGRIGSQLTLHTFQYLEQQAQGASFIPRLVGFAEPADRRFFELFTRVKGVGVKKALRAMAVPVSEIADAIVSRDVAALKELPEIGKKLAETIVLELREGAAPFAGPSRPGGGPGPGEPAAGIGGLGGSLTPAGVQTIAALVRLGENRTDAEDRVRRFLKQAGERAADLTPDELLSGVFSLRS